MAFPPSRDVMSSALLKYLPKVVINHYEEKAQLSKKINNDNAVFKPLIPDHQQTNCVSMFIDVAGFTMLTSDLAQFPDGSGQLAAALNNAMISIVSVINKSNGDIVKFAGDAILVMWPLKERKELPPSIQRVVAIALNLVNNLEYNRFKIIDPDERNFFDNQVQEETPTTPLSIANEEKTLEIKVGVSYGLAKILYLGGVPDNIVKTRCDYLPVGPALQEAFIAEGQCKASQLVVPKKVHDLEIIQRSFKMTPVVGETKETGKVAPSNTSKYSIFHIRNQKKPSTKKLGRPRKGSVHKNSVVVLDDIEHPPSHYLVLEMITRVNLNRIGKKLVSFENIGKALWSYVPVAIVPYFSDISLEFWLPEMRTVTTLFCGLNVSHLQINRLYEDDTLYTSNDVNAIKVVGIQQKIQDVFTVIQETVFKYQGTVNKFLVDDKGCSVLIAFGLPPFAHVSDPDRAALCAYGIMGNLGKVKVSAYIGITTGLVYCGAIGGNSGISAQRIEYTIIGDPINVAARLMSLAKDGNYKIVMDENTKLLLREKVSTQYLEGVKLKGKTGFYDCYQVITSEDDSYVSEWNVRRSARIYTSSIFSSQLKLGQAADLMVSAFTGENLQAKLSKLNIDEEFISTSFSKRLEVHSSRRRYKSIVIEYTDNGNIKTMGLPIDEKFLKSDDDIQKIKLEALKQLNRLKWKELKRYSTEEATDEIVPENLQRKGTDTLLHSNLDPEEVHLLKVATRYSMFWKIDSERLFEVNDSVSLNRFKIATNELVFRLSKSLSWHWKQQTSGHHLMKRRRHDTMFKENCFSVVDRLHCIANDFYSTAKKTKKVRQSGTNMKTVLLEASNGTGKTFAVSDLINTVLKTTSYEVLISGGDPFEDGQNTQPFIVIATVLRQLLELRANKANVNNLNLFSKDFINRVLNKKADTLRLATTKPEDPEQYAKIIYQSLARASTMFEGCQVPVEAKETEKNKHVFNPDKLHLLDEILGTEFGKSMKAPSSSASKTFSSSLVASKALSAIITQNNFVLGEDFKSKKVERMSMKINNKMSQRLSALKSMRAAAEKRKRVTQKYFASQLDEFNENEAKIPFTAVEGRIEDEEDNQSDVTEDQMFGNQVGDIDVFSHAFNEPERPTLGENPRKTYKSPTNLFELEPSPQAKAEKLKQEKEEKRYLGDMKEVVKLFAAILAGLTSDKVPLLIHIDNAHRADPFSLLVIQELTQWWSSANIMLLLCTQKPFSADVGLTNIGNYVLEAGKRMSVVTLKFDVNVELSDIVLELENSPNENVAETRTNTSFLIMQLKELANTTRIDLVPDRRYTQDIIELAAFNQGMFEVGTIFEPISVDEKLVKYLRERAGGHFLYIQEVIQLYNKHELIKMDESGTSLVLTPKGTQLFQKALKPNRQTKRQAKSRRPKRKAPKQRPSVLLPTLVRSADSAKFLAKETYRVPVRNLSRLIPGSLNAAFSEYFDALGVKEQLLLKCAALIARTNKTIHKGQFNFLKVKQVCPFLQDTDKNAQREIEADEAFELLENTQLIAPVEKRFSDNRMGKKNKENSMYKFRSDWYTDILISRLLPSQLERIQRRIEHFRREAENEFFLKVPVRERSFRGFLSVKQSGRHGFKKRFCVLENGAMMLFKDDPEKQGSGRNTCMTKIMLNTDSANVSYYDGPSFKSRIFGPGGEADRSFVVKSNRFEMKGYTGVRKQDKDWVCVAKDTQELELWLTKVRLQIRLSNSKKVKLDLSLNGSGNSKL